MLQCSIYSHSRTRYTHKCTVTYRYFVTTCHIQSHKIHNTLQPKQNHESTVIPKAVRNKLSNQWEFITMEYTDCRVIHRDDTPRNHSTRTQQQKYQFFTPDARSSINQNESPRTTRQQEKANYEYHISPRMTRQQEGESRISHTIQDDTKKQQLKQRKAIADPQEVCVYKSINLLSVCIKC